MATFNGIQHIGEKVFNFVPSESILNCRKVCKSWKQILDNPELWLKKLNAIGQTKTTSKDCLFLLKKASKLGLPESVIGHCLLIKYSKVTSDYSSIVSLEFKEIRKFWLNLPLLYYTLIPKVPNLELVNLILKFSKIKPNRAPPSHYQYLRGMLIKFPHQQYCRIYPLKDAIEGNNTLEVIKLFHLELKSKKVIHDYLQDDHLKMAIKMGNVEVCKMFAEDIRSYREHEIKLAIDDGKVDVLEFLLTKTKIAAGKYLQSPMDLIIENCQRKKNDESHKCVDMAKVLLPKLQNNINDQIMKDQNRTLMHKIVMKMYKKSSECMIEILKLISPIADHNLKDIFGETAMDYAKRFELEPALEIFISLKKRKLDHQ